MIVTTQWRLALYRRQLYLYRQEIPTKKSITIRTSYKRIIDDHNFSDYNAVPNRIAPVDTVKPLIPFIISEGCQIRATCFVAAKHIFRMFTGYIGGSLKHTAIEDRMLNCEAIIALLPPQQLAADKLYSFSV